MFHVCMLELVAASAHALFMEDSGTERFSNTKMEVKHAKWITRHWPCPGMAAQ